jgi:hypothetical protein
VSTMCLAQHAHLAVVELATGAHEEGIPRVPLLLLHSTEAATAGDGYRLRGWGAWLGANIPLPTEGASFTYLHKVGEVVLPLAMNQEVRKIEVLVPAIVQQASASGAECVVWTRAPGQPCPTRLTG